MTRAGPLQWASGAGWLILVGGGEWRGEEVDIDDRILALADFARPIAYLPAAGGALAAGEALLDEYAALGAPRGYVVPILRPADAWNLENRRLLAEAGIVILGEGDGLTLLRTLRGTPALEGMAEAFADGALIVAVGRSAAPLGAWVLADEATSELEGGWGWMGGTLLLPHWAGAVARPQVQVALRGRAGLLGIGLPERTALALGPDGQVENWGEGQITVVVAP